MSIELKAAERLENLRKQHGGICTPYACNICWLLEQLDKASQIKMDTAEQFVRPVFEKMLQLTAPRYRRRIRHALIIGFGLGVSLSAFFLVLWVFVVDGPLSFR